MPDIVPDSQGANGDEADDLAERITRWGWIAKGLLFAIIGVVAVELARRGPGATDADQRGALERIASAPAGRSLVFVVGIGLLLFATWQGWSAVRRSESGWLGFAKRTGWLGLGAAYALLGVTGLRLAWAGARETATDDGGPTSPTGAAELLLGLPAGRLVVIAIGLVTLGVGAYHLNKGVRREFLDDIDTTDLQAAHRKALLALGIAGFAARSALLGVAGWLFISAAWQFDPDEAAGIDQSLQAIAQATPGRVFLMLVAGGLFCAGIYDIVTYRRQRLTE